VSAASPWLRAVAGGVEIDVLVSPRASRDRLMGIHDARLKVAVAAPPVEGEANDALVRFLASVLGVKQRQVAIARGATGKRKTIRVEGVDAAAAAVKLSG
jgi:hypothetical protein